MPTKRTVKKSAGRSALQAAITGHLQAEGGEITDGQGRTAAIIGKAIGQPAQLVGQELTALEQAGKVTRNWHAGRRRLLGVRLTASQPASPVQSNGRGDRTARVRVLQYLATHGPVEDLTNGKATALLKDIIGYEGSSTGIGQLLLSLDKAGQVGRDVIGKRTYRIFLKPGVHIPSLLLDGEPAEPAPPPPAPEDESGEADHHLDYDELAATLLQRVARLLTSENGSTAVRRRLDQALGRITELERETARIRAERDTSRAQCEELTRQLEAASSNLTILTERLNERSPRRRTADQLRPDERALLDQLSHSGASA